MKVLFANQMQIRLFVKFIYGVCYWGNFCVFFITKYVSSCSIAWILNFTLLGRILNFLELFSIIKDPFAKYLFTKRDRQFNMKVEFGFSMNSWKYTNFSNTSGMPIQINILKPFSQIFYWKKYCLRFWIDNIYSQYKHKPLWDNNGNKLIPNKFVLVLLL